MIVVLLFLLMTAQGPPDEIHLSAAASLKDVLEELSGSYVRRHPGVRVVRNYGSSGMLARQIESGAPSDIFVSANQEWMDYLRERRLVDPGSIGALAYNTLVFVGPEGKAAGMRDVGALQRIAIGSPKSVPAGEYAMAALRAAGIDRELEGKLIMAKDVRECLMYAERGEVDGAFVYRTDALLAKQVKILFTVPEQLYPRVAYSMSLTVSGAGRSDAAAFVAFLRGSEAKEALARHGFAVR
jgi:molybdate transport system substrate-binding protein